jgi:hypothetical protein
MLHFWIAVNMSWQVQQHFDKIMRHHDNFEKYYSDKTKKFMIERFQDSFNVYGSILKYNNGILTYTKGM